MKGKKIITVLIIIILILAGIIYNLISKLDVDNKKQVIKEMTESEQVANLNSAIDKLNSTHDEYIRRIEIGKNLIATEISQKGVETSKLDTLETMANNIRSIANSSSNSYRFEKIADFTISGDSTVSISSNNFSEIQGVVFKATWNNSYAIFKMKDLINYDGIASGALSWMGSLNISITFDKEDIKTVKIKNGDTGTKCKVTNFYFIGLSG